jgi:hypothetical protein
MVQALIGFVIRVPSSMIAPDTIGHSANTAATADETGRERSLDHPICALKDR